MTAIEELLRHADRALQAFDANAPDATDRIAAAIALLSAGLDEHAQHRAVIGPVLGRLRSAASAAADPARATADWVEVGGGRLAIGHRPRLRSLPELRRAGATHVLTLLAASEGARAIGDAAQEAGLAWLWLPLPDGDPPAAAATPPITAMMARLSAIFAAGGAVFVHCSAGIHRTGMFSYALLRQLGQSAEAAQRTLAALREVTRAEVGDARMAWGDDLARDVRVATADAETTEWIYRPTGARELALVAASGYRRWPPRLPDQPIFYPVASEAYAREIAERWNVPQNGAGYVTRFQVRKRFLDRYPLQCVGAAHHLEWWIPAENLEALNDEIVGVIEVLQRFEP